MPTLKEKFRRFAAPIVMLLGVIVLYLPPGTAAGEFELLGTDYLMLHQHRIDFAQTHLANGTLPAWYSRELCGSPFWSNVQNFPFIPTRLALLWLPPANLFPASVIVSAMLAALFTFCFARRLGIGSVGSAVAGWTFAASGFYASRIAAGHLPLLEAYPALPLLLWLVDRAAEPLPGRRWFDARLLALGLATTAVSLAGHPQLWVYALCVALLYAVVRCPWRRAIRVIAALLAGLGCASFALWPMMQLIGRSTRVLPLDRAMNDLAMPYGRLLAAFLPWRDGFPISSPSVESIPLVNLPHPAYFWDTVWYVGLMPWAATLLLLTAWMVGRSRPDRRAWFLVVVSLGALALSLPWTRELASAAGGTILRSPARLVYITTLGLGIAAGAGVCLVQRMLLARPGAQRGVVVMIIILIIAAHAVDLGRHDRQFIVGNHLKTPLPADVEQAVIHEVGDGRVAIDPEIPIAINRKLDDVSFFDSIMLARSYRFIMAMKNARAGYNNQFIQAYSFDGSMLRACGARLLLTSKERPGLPLARRVGLINFYRIDNAAPRASYFPIGRVARGSEADVDRMLREQTLRLPEMLVVEQSDVPPATQPMQDAPAPVRYRRPGSDSIVIEVNVPAEGFVEILEAFDPGWHATLDGQPAAIAPANLMFIAVRVGPGSHTIELNYSTPGRAAGLVLSAVGFVALLAIALNFPLRVHRGGARRRAT